jgi:hypothetical protein
MFIFQKKESRLKREKKLLSLVRVIIRRGIIWRIGFIDTLYTPFGTTGNYSAIVDLHTLQFTVTHTLGFSVLHTPLVVSW